MKIKVHPAGVEIPGDPNKSVMQICMENKIELKSLCKGIPSCAECRIRVLAGESNLIPPTRAELALIGTSYYLDGRRLACQLHAFGDISIDISEHLDINDHSNKKVRGFRAANKSFDSKAIQGTLILEEAQTKKK
jgi:ferredoxin, 2Fe-2S